MQKGKKKAILLWITVIILIVIVFGATYAYFQAQTGLGAQTGVNVTAETTDSLMFEVGEDISIEAGQHNFGEGMDNKSGSTYARAVLKSTTDTPYTYNVYLDMKKNGFNYTTSDNKPEIMLKITNPNGEEVTSGIDGVTYTSVVDGLGNTIAGFDLTPLNSSNVLKIATNYEIKTTSTITQDWNIEIILINLNSNQSANAGSSFSAKLVARKEEHAGAKLLRQVSYNDTTSMWEHKEKITNIVFEDNAKVYDNAEYTYDISSLQDESIMAYMINNGDDTYTTYINSDGKITANSDSSYLFYEFTNLILIEGLENIDTSQVTDMHSMFDGCSSLTILDVSNFDTSQVTNMGRMFNGCGSLTALDLSNFDTSQVTNMYGMFQYCKSLTLLDITSFDTSQTTNMDFMFWECSGLTELDLTNFDTSKVTSMTAMFAKCIELTILDLSTWDTSQVTNMSYMFGYMFSKMKLTEIKFGNKWNTSKVNDMSYMFVECSNLTKLDVSHFDTSKVTNMSQMFYNCSSLTTLDISHFDTSRVTNMANMFYDCSSLTTLDVNNFNTSKVTNMYGMFYNCESLTTLDVSGFDTSQVNKMTYMFYNCSSLTTLDLSNFDTSQVTGMMYMFGSSNNLTSLDLSNFDTSNVTNMSHMFDNCSSLTTLDFRNADFTNVTNYELMFLVVPSTIQVTVKDQTAKEFIEARLGSGKGTVTIA